MDATESGHAARVSAYAAVGARLSLVSDRRLEDAVGAAPGLGSGIGGRSAEMQVEGVRVFVKRVPLTDVELRPKHARSTANLFGLPLFYQYGVGSAGFGAWRELAAHIMTTGWVLGDAYAGFPLLYHWRVLPDTPPTGFADEFGGVEGAVAHWDGSPAVRRRCAGGWKPLDGQPPAWCSSWSMCPGRSARGSARPGTRPGRSGEAGRPIHGSRTRCGGGRSS